MPDKLTLNGGRRASLIPNPAPAIVSRAAPGPAIVTDVVSPGSTDCTWIVRGVAKKVGSKVMMEGVELWLAMAARREPVPESFAFVTIKTRGTNMRNEPTGPEATTTAPVSVT